jgi:3D (Asp-Asp-Asp) domain-containing protein
MKVILLTVLLGSYTPTAYRSVPNQTDSSPHFTATGEKTCGHGIAISQDLLKKNGGPLEYGDTVYIEGIGIKYVFDAMNKRHKNRIDIWVPTYKEEKEFDLKFRNQKLRMWKIYSEYEKEPVNGVRKMRMSDAKNEIRSLFLQ